SATGTALTGSYDFRFSLFTDATVGESLWTSDHAAVTVQNGFYSVRLGSLVPIPASTLISARHLDIKVRRTGTTSYDTLAPRVRLSHSPFAVSADTLSGHAASEFAMLDESSAVIASGIVAFPTAGSEEAGPPAIRYNGTTWEYTNDGVSFHELGSSTGGGDIWTEIDGTIVNVNEGADLDLGGNLFVSGNAHFGGSLNLIPAAEIVSDGEGGFQTIESDTAFVNAPTFLHFAMNNPNGDSYVAIYNNSEGGSANLDVGGSIFFSGELAPFGDAGVIGQVLTSQGPGMAPIWADAGSNSGGFVTFDDLSNYVTFESLDVTLSGYALSSDLSNYATNSNVSIMLEDFVPQSQFSSSLLNYATFEDLSSYALSSDLDNYLTLADAEANYYSNVGGVLHLAPMETPAFGNVGDVYTDGFSVYFWDGGKWADLGGEVMGGGGSSNLFEGFNDPGEIYIVRTNDTEGTPFSVQGGDTVGAVQFGGWDGSQIVAGSAGIVAIATQSYYSEGNGTALQFNTTANDSVFPATRMTVSSEGNVGIGTAEPAYPLEVYGDMNVNGELYVFGQPISGSIGGGGSLYHGVNEAAIFELARNNEIDSIETALLTGDTIGKVGFAGHDGIDLSPSQAFMEVFAADEWTSTSHPTTMTFWATNYGSIEPEQVLTVTPSGRVGIRAGDPEASLSVTGRIDKPLTGTISLASGDDRVFGTGTLFTSELAEGDLITFAGLIGYFTVNAIASDSQLSVHEFNTGDAFTEVSAFTADADYLLMIGNDGGDPAEFVVTSSGRVGIKNEFPSQALDVNGAIRLQSDAPPGGATGGEIYSDGVDLYFYNGFAWNPVLLDMGGSVSAGGWSEGDGVVYSTGQVAIGTQVAQIGYPMTVDADASFAAIFNDASAMGASGANVNIVFAGGGDSGGVIGYNAGTFVFSNEIFGGGFEFSSFEGGSFSISPDGGFVAAGTGILLDGARLSPRSLPTEPNIGDLVVDLNDNILKWYDGFDWQSAGSAGAGGGATTYWNLEGITLGYSDSLVSVGQVSFADAVLHVASAPVVMQDGFVSVTNNSSTVFGTGTTFTLLSPGTPVTFDGDATIYEVSSVTSDTELELAFPYTGTTSSESSMYASPDAIFAVNDFTGQIALKVNGAGTTEVGYTGFVGAALDICGAAVFEPMSQPSSPESGYVYSDGTSLFFFDGSTWIDLAGGGTSSAAGWTIESGTEFLVYNDSTVSIGDSGYGAALQVAPTLVQQIQGTVDVTNGSTTVVGTNTFFNIELSGGDSIKIGGTEYTIATVTDDTNLELALAYENGTDFGLPAYKKTAQAFIVADYFGNSAFEMTGDGRAIFGSYTSSNEERLVTVGGVFRLDGAEGVFPPSEPSLGDMYNDGSSILAYDGTTWVDLLGGGGGSSLWTDGGGSIYYDAGYVGVGTTLPAANLHVASLGEDATLFLQGDPQGFGTRIKMESGGTQSWSIYNDSLDDSLWIGNDSMEVQVLYIDATTNNIGIQNTAPAYTLDVDGDINFTGSLLQNGSPFSAGGGGTATVEVISVGTTLDATHDVVVVDTSAGLVSITLPDPSANSGRRYTIKRRGVNDVFLSVDLSGSIDGYSGGHAIDVDYGFVTLVSDGTEWLIIAGSAQAQF
ncbi:MAG: hypothetical protein NUW37_02610, partial [Planctomycetes bacterium]|nr:hypothetical protein [Planctomycetota bacterium]